MNIYKLEQTTNRARNSYKSCIVQATTPEEAVKIHPYFGNWDNRGIKYSGNYVWFDLTEWTEPKNVTVTLVGVTDKDFPKDSVIGAELYHGEPNSGRGLV